MSISTPFRQTSTRAPTRRHPRAASIALALLLLPPAPLAQTPAASPDSPPAATSATPATTGAATGATSATSATTTATGATPRATNTAAAAGALEQLRDRLAANAPLYLQGLIIFLAFWLVAWIGRRLIALAAPRVKADTSVVLLLSRLCYYGVLIFGVVTALGTAGLDIRALVAGLGLTGFALGFALKDVLSNFVSGVMLLAYRPFRIGDVIEMGEHLGRIEDIRIRDTLVRAEDGHLVIIPNTKLITEVVINHSDAPDSARAGRTGDAPRGEHAADAPPAEQSGEAARLAAARLRVAAKRASNAKARAAAADTSEAETMNAER
jgi:Mechanosensitive ion channel